MPDKQSVLDDYDFIRNRIAEIAKEREQPPPKVTQEPICEACQVDGRCNGLCLG